MARVIVKGRSKKKNYSWIYVLTIMISVLFIFFGNKIASKNMTAFDNSGDMMVVRAKIVEIVDVIEATESIGADSTITIRDIIFRANLESGPEKGTEITGVQSLNSYFVTSPREVSIGDKIILYEFQNETYLTNWVFGDYVRTDALLILGVIFAVLLIIFGRSKGLQTLISLTFTILAVFFVFVPAILSGYNIYIWTMIVCVFVIFMTLIIVSGISIKTVAASIGCLSGVLFSAGMVFVMDYFLKLTGVVDQDSVYLILLNPENPINLKGIFFGSIVIGAMGAIMDVSMSISSALFEMKEKYAANSWSQLVNSGMTIGRDIMGTMANTLVLAYIGSSLSIVLLLIAYNPSMLDLMNREMVIIEILQALIGSLGILMTLPLTAIVSGLLYSRTIDKNRLRNRV
ncbi:MAG TPA: YibE/F family protein [Clostridiales bacterium UBA8960]|nr:YibE/F family protein [Clostridiales bacterium UBA8960]